MKLEELKKLLIELKLAGITYRELEECLKAAYSATLVDYMSQWEKKADETVEITKRGEEEQR